MAHLLLEDYASKQNKILKDPKFQTLFNNYTYGMMGGRGGLTPEKFLYELVTNFDPTSTVKIENNPDDPAKPKIVGDANYIDFILQNLYSGNISLSDYEDIKPVLNAYRIQVIRKNPNISKDLQSYKVFYRDENVKGRDGQVLPGLVESLQAHVPRFDFANNRHSNLSKTERVMRENNIPLVFETSEHKFYLIQNIDVAKKVIATRSKFKVGNIDTWHEQEMSKWCSGYWCLPEHFARNYYPAWIAVDVYGFMDYAIVPKPSEHPGAGEIKNRFNHRDSIETMPNADYNSLLQFFLEYDNSIPSLPFKQIYQRYSGSGEGFYSSNYRGEYTGFLARVPDVQTFNKLTDANLSNDNNVCLFFAGVNMDRSILTQEQYQRVVVEYLVNPYNTFIKSVKHKYPLIARLLRGLHETSLKDTQLSYDNYLANYIPSMIGAFKQAFTQETNLFSDNIKKFKILLDFISLNLPAIHRIQPNVAEQFNDKISNLIEQDLLYFADDQPIQNINKCLKEFNNAELTNSITDVNSKSYKALRDAFDVYMSMGGSTGWLVNDESYSKVNYTDLITYMADRESDEEKERFIRKFVVGSLAGADYLRVFNTTDFAYITVSIDHILSQIKLPGDAQYTVVFGALEKVYNKFMQSEVSQGGTTIRMNHVSACTWLIKSLAYASEVVEHAKKIAKVAPNVSKFIAMMHPTSAFGKLYPNKYNGIIRPNVKLARAQRIKILKELYRGADDVYGRNEIKLNPDTEWVDIVNGVKLPATKENIQKFFSLVRYSYSNTESVLEASFLACFNSLLTNDKFVPQTAYMSLGGETFGFALATAESRTVARSVIFKLTIVGKISNGETIAVMFNTQALVENVSIARYLPNRQANEIYETYAEFKNSFAETMFDHYIKPRKPAFATLVERMHTTFGIQL